MIIIRHIRDSLTYRYHRYIEYHFPFFRARYLYKTELGKRADFKNPRDLNEKIQWLEFFTDTSQWTILADKYAVRQYVKDRIGVDCLVPLLGKWNQAKDIDFNLLPKSFVIKPNNGSYDTIVVKDKNSIDLENVRQRLSKSLTRRFGLGNAEPHYLRIKPCIIAEQLLETTSAYGLVDYKIWCFNGHPHSLLACFNRDEETHHADFMAYDLEWNRHPEWITPEYRNDCHCERPANFAKMVEIAAQLSVGLPQCRVDLYNIDGKIFFGEMTLTANYGMIPYYTQEHLNIMGNLCVLPTPNWRESLTCFAKRYIPVF